MPLIDWHDANRRGLEVGAPSLIVTQLIVGTFASGMAYDGRYVDQVGARVGSFGRPKKETHDVSSH